MIPIALAASLALFPMDDPVDQFGNPTEPKGPWSQAGELTDDQRLLVDELVDRLAFCLAVLAQEQGIDPFGDEPYDLPGDLEDAFPSGTPEGEPQLNWHASPFVPFHAIELLSLKGVGDGSQICGLEPKEDTDAGSGASKPVFTDVVGESIGYSKFKKDENGDYVTDENGAPVIEGKINVGMLINMNFIETSDRPDGAVVATLLHELLHFGTHSGDEGDVAAATAALLCMMSDCLTTETDDDGMPVPDEDLTPDDLTQEIFNENLYALDNGSTHKIACSAIGMSCELLCANIEAREQAAKEGEGDPGTGEGEGEPEEEEESLADKPCCDAMGVETSPEGEEELDPHSDCEGLGGGEEEGEGDPPPGEGQGDSVVSDPNVNVYGVPLQGKTIVGVAPIDSGLQSTYRIELNPQTKVVVVTAFVPFEDLSTSYFIDLPADVYAASATPIGDGSEILIGAYNDVTETSSLFIWAPGSSVQSFDDVLFPLLVDGEDSMGKILDMRHATKPGAPTGFTAILCESGVWALEDYVFDLHLFHSSRSILGFDLIRSVRADWTDHRLDFVEDVTSSSLFAPGGPVVPAGGQGPFTTTATRHSHIGGGGLRASVILRTEETVGVFDYVDGALASGELIDLDQDWDADILDIYPASPVD